MRITTFYLISVLASFVALMLPASVVVAQGGGDSAVLGVDVKILSFGVGGATRSGSWAGLRVGLRSNETEPRPVSVVWEMTDPDGDIAEVSARTVLNPGGSDSVWLYGRLSFRATANSQWTINVYGVNDKGERLNKVIGALRFRAQTILDPDISLIGVLGLRHGGLNGYAMNIQNGSYSVSANERTQIITGLSTNQLPTRWMGLDQFESLVWMGPDPASLSLEQAQSIEEWVRRGGHLVIVLPDLAQRWENTLLGAILPDVKITSVEDQEIRDGSSAGGVLRYLMRPVRPEGAVDREVYRVPPQARQPRYPVVTLHIFEPNSDSGWGGSESIALMPISLSFARQIGNMRGEAGNGSDAGGGDGNAVGSFAVERRVGFGQVTMVGVPVTNPLLNRPGVELPEAEVFWNRILGRRSDTPTPSELNKIKLSKSPSKRLNNARDSRAIGNAIAGSIELKSEGGTGFLLALVVFVLYWIISGPLAFAMLKKHKWERQSWLAFALVGVVFTVIGWTGAKLLRAGGILPRHLTIIDHVYGEAWEHSRTYLTAALEGYGVQPVVTGVVEGEGRGDFYDTVTPFYDQSTQSSPFPDPRRYVVTSDDQREVDYPARSTAKQMAIDSMHHPVAGWGMPTFAGEAEKPRIIHPGGGIGGGRSSSDSGWPSLSGVLTHSLPGALEECEIIFVSDQEWSTFGRRPDGQRMSVPRLVAFSWKISKWEPGKPFDLAADLVPTSQSLFWSPAGSAKSSSGLSDIMKHYYRSNALGMNTSGTGGYSLNNLRYDIRALSVFRYLDQPDWVGPIKGSPHILLRRFGRELDMSDWLNRPCLIILGNVHEGEEGRALPAPIRIGGKLIDKTAADSHVFIRWVYPFGSE